MSDYDFFSMSSNRKNVNKYFFKKNVRFQHFSKKNAGTGKVVRN